MESFFRMLPSSEWLLADVSNAHHYSFHTFSAIDLAASWFFHGFLAFLSRLVGRIVVPYDVVQIISALLDVRAGDQ